MKLKTRSVTILTDDEVALVSGGEASWLSPWYSFECQTRECDPYETNECYP